CQRTGRTPSPRSCGRWATRTRLSTWSSSLPRTVLKLWKSTAATATWDTGH
ncbi:unnamed protein product, partial [Symbiodinium pilosum]